MNTSSQTHRFVAGAAMAFVILGSVASAARADGTPVVSLEPMVLGRTGITVYSDRPAPVVSLPVRRVITNGENVEIEYDTSAAPRAVTARPVARIVGSGENASIEYDDAGGHTAPHVMPRVAGGHNAALWNHPTLPPSIR
jgi:hypothetical protein